MEACGPQHRIEPVVIAHPSWFKEELRVKELEKQVADLRETLAYYAEWRNYRWAAPDERNSEHNESYCAIMQNDRWLGGEPGSRARAALASNTGKSAK